MTVYLLALAAGALIGLSLGALGGGGSILAVPVLVYLLGQSPVAATTGSLVVVGVSALIGAYAAHRRGNVKLGQGVTFGLVGVAGAVLGADASRRVPETVLMGAFAVLMVVVGLLMAYRLRHPLQERATTGPDEPILSFSPTFICACPRALKVVLTATAVGLLTGFLGVGGGFVVVPALVLALHLPMRYAAGTSLVVITLTSVTALAVRAGVGAQPDWGVVLALTLAATAATVLGARIADRVDHRSLAKAFTGLVLAVAAYTVVQTAAGL